MDPLIASRSRAIHGTLVPPRSGSAVACALTEKQSADVKTALPLRHALNHRASGPRSTTTIHTHVTQISPRLLVHLHQLQVSDPRAELRHAAPKPLPGLPMVAPPRRRARRSPRVLPGTDDAHRHRGSPRRRVSHRASLQRLRHTQVQPRGRGRSGAGVAGPVAAPDRKPSVLARRYQVIAPGCSGPITANRESSSRHTVSCDQ